MGEDSVLWGPQPVMSPPTSFSLVVAGRVHFESIRRPCSRASRPMMTTCSAMTRNHLKADRHGGHSISLRDLDGRV